MRRPCFGLFLLGLLLGSCVTLKSDPTVCSEYRELSCMGQPRCLPDKARGCRVCICQEFNRPTQIESERVIDRR
jgi:hypothetical protein